MLGAAVSRLQRNASIGQGGPDLNDCASVAGEHALHGSHGAVDSAEVSDFGRAAKFLGSHFVEGREDGEHRIVDPDVDRSKGFFNLRGREFDLVMAGDVGFQDQCLAAEGLSVASRAFQPLDFAGNEADFCATFGEGLCCCTANACRSARDYDNLRCWRFHNSSSWQ